MYKTLILSVAAAALFSGCKTESNVTPSVREVGTFSGCRVEYVIRGGHEVYNFYIAHCPAASDTVTRLVETRSGKSSTSIPSSSITTTEDPRDIKIRQLEAQLDAVRSSLDSLK